MESLKDLLQEIQSQGITAYEIEKATGIAQSTIGRILKGETKRPNASTVAAIRKYVKWKDRPAVVAEPEGIYVNFNHFKLVPLVTQRARAGFLAGWEDPEYLEELPKVPWEVDREYKGRYLTFEVAGDSMESIDNPRESLYEGDLLLCREVGRQHWRNRLHIRQWDFVLAHAQQGVLVKRIAEHNTETGELTLHSLNPYYQDFTVNMNDLIAIFNIVDIKRSMRR